MTHKDPFLEGTFWDKFWRPIRSRALLFTPDRCKTGLHMVQETLGRPLRRGSERPFAPPLLTTFGHLLPGALVCNFKNVVSFFRARPKAEKESCGGTVVQKSAFGQSVFFSAPSRFAVETPENLRIY